jgi:catechol 2,3-dioxygenase
MGTTTHDIFGDAAAALAAEPESYGEAPRGHRLPAATRLGRVRLQVTDLARSLAFYQGVLGLRVVERDASRAVLAARDDDASVVELHELAGARPMTSRARLGLFHFAILLPDRAALGRFLRHLAETDVPVRASDHLVSEALYLHDPDGLGIEVYADRPRASWRRVGRELMIATDPLDMADLLRAAGTAPWVGMPAGTAIGHVHLHVGDLASASAFYCEALGFDRITWRYPGALFLGAGGYHHHLGTNTWAGAAARPPAANDVRLLEWTIELPDAASVAAAAESLARAGYAAERGEPAAGAAELVTRDPWGTQIRLRAVEMARREP